MYQTKAQKAYMDIIKKSVPLSVAGATAFEISQKLTEERLTSFCEKHGLGSETLALLLEINQGRTKSLSKVALVEQLAYAAGVSPDMMKTAIVHQRNIAAARKRTDWDTFLGMYKQAYLERIAQKEAERVIEEQFS